jgi:hypothetical protein
MLVRCDVALMDPHLQHVLLAPALSSQDTFDVDFFHMLMDYRLQARADVCFVTEDLSQFVSVHVLNQTHFTLFNCHRESSSSFMRVLALGEKVMYFFNDNPLMSIFVAVIVIAISVRLRRAAERL